MSTDRLVVAPDVCETLHERRAAGAPAEVCGVLLGERAVAAGTDTTHADADATPDRVSEAVPVDNVAADPERFYELDPAATVEAIEAGEARGLDTVGFYHSHPRGPAEPSATDRDRATWTGHVYCIVAPDDLLAYRWTGGAFRPLRVETP